MVSAHLYELGDLGATLLESLRTANHSLAIQVVKELRVSGEEAYCYNLLTFAWCLSSPNSIRDAAIAHAYTNNNLEDMLFALFLQEPYEYADMDESVVIPPPKPSKTPPPAAAWSNLPQAYTPQQAHTLFRAIKYALKHKFWEHAAYLIKSLLKEHTQVIIALLSACGIQPKLIQLIESTVYAPLLPRIIEHILSAHVGSPGPIQKEKRLVMMLKTPCKGRTFHILPEARAMWNVKPKSPLRLQGAPLLIMEDDASQYWKAAKEKYNISSDKDRLQFADESVIEEFYTTYFPQDIPDEWSELERSKSHDGRMPTILEMNPWQAAFHCIN